MKIVIEREIDIYGRRVLVPGQVVTAEEVARRLVDMGLARWQSVELSRDIPTEVKRRGRPHGSKAIPRG